MTSLMHPPAIGTLLIAGLTGLVLSILLGMKFPRLWIALLILGAGGLLFAAVRPLLHGVAWEWRSAFLVGTEAIHLRLDGISALFLALVSVIGSAGAVYSREYWSDGERGVSAAWGRFWWSGLVSTMGLLVTTVNGLHFLVVWELFALCAYFLITLDRGNRGSLEGGWLYLAASHAGTLALVAFFGGLAARTGSWDLGPVRDRPELAPLYWLALFGFGVKAGMFPFHIWLPSAHANAPSHVSAIMSGVAIKMGVYGLVRFGGWLPVTEAQAVTVIGAGAVSAVLGMSFALAQNDLKRLLAYCSVENVGVILVGLGAALLSFAHANAAWGRLALSGALLHVWNHGLFKSLLFLGAGSALHATGTRDISRLGGLRSLMPWTAAFFVVGSVAVAALPPLNGFVSEWLIYLGLFDLGISRSHYAWAAAGGIIGLAAAGAITLASFVKANGLVFLGAPRTESARRAHECGTWMKAPMMVLAGLCVAIGCFPAPICLAIAGTNPAWNPAWGIAPVPASLELLGLANLGLAAFLLAAIVLLRTRVRGVGTSRAPTWGCGYGAPTGRMQYSGGSFSRLVLGWTRLLVRPDTRFRRPRGVFPRRSDFMENAPDAVLERLVVPAGHLVLAASTILRRLQHGRLQAYVLYLAAGLGLIAAVALGAYSR